jgi:L-fuconolactonase
MSAVRIDAHLHFWRPDCGFDNRPVADHPAYRRNFLPADVAPSLERCHVDGVLLVQTCPQVEETAWLLDLAADDPRILGITGWVDLDDPACDVDALARHPRVAGLRAQLRRIADDAFVMRPNVLRNLAAALRAGLAVTVLAEQRHAAHVRRALDTLPPGPITLNHLGMPFAAVERAQWGTPLRAYAARPDVVVQLYGLPFLFGERWRDPDPRSVLDDVLDLFGPQRLLFASDWPMMLRFATYEDWVREVERFVAARGLGAADVDAIFAANVLRANPRLAAPVTGAASAKAGRATAALTAPAAPRPVRPNH